MLRYTKWKHWCLNNFSPYFKHLEHLIGGHVHCIILHDYYYLLNKYFAQNEFNLIVWSFYLFRSFWKMSYLLSPRLNLPWFLFPADLGRTVDDLIANWTNPMFATVESGILDAQCSNNPHSSIRAQSTIHPYRFTKAMFQDIKVNRIVGELQVLSMWTESINFMCS